MDSRLAMELQAKEMEGQGDEQDNMAFEVNDRIRNQQMEAYRDIQS